MLQQNSGLVTIIKGTVSGTLWIKRKVSNESAFCARMSIIWAKLLLADLRRSIQACRELQHFQERCHCSLNYTCLLYTSTWKHLFSNTILKRGEAYYRNGDVTPKKTAENSNTKTFYVQGTERYIVKIAKGKDAIKRMQCDCPYARSGARCKHMAAALFQMEADGELAMHASTSETNIASNAKAKSNTKSILVSRTKPVEVFPFKQETRTASRCV